MSEGQCEREQAEEGAGGVPMVANQEALLCLLQRTGYPMVQENGQRRYGPPPSWSGPSPPKGCEVFVGKIPRYCFEDELVPIFERAGPIYELRLMMDFSGSNRGYAFVMYTSHLHARTAIATLNNFELRPGSPSRSRSLSLSSPSYSLQAFFLSCLSCTGTVRF